MWCWPQELKQPLILMWRFLTASSSTKLLAQAISNLCRQAARGSDAQLAGIRTRARCDIDNCARARLVQPNALQFTVQIRQISLADPSQHDILFHSRADIVAAETA